MTSEKLIFVATLNKKVLSLLKLKDEELKVYRSKGLLAHILKRKHFKAAKYLDYISDIIENPDYAGMTDSQIELVKIFKDNIFLSIKLDAVKKMYYVATMFDVSLSKINAYCKSGRLIKLDKSHPSDIIRMKFDEQERHPALPNGNLI